MNFNWSEITSLAYLTLIEQKINSFPITQDKIKCKGAKIVSFQKYSEVTGLSIEDITCNLEIDDAFVLSNIRPGLKLILYNNQKYNRRLKHTLWHEIGHIKCGHNEHGEKEEIEAHFFASQTNAPNIIIKELSERGYTINQYFLEDCFGLSKESAKKKISYLAKYSFDHTNEFDDVLLTQFYNYINLNYPPRTRHYYDSYYDDLENKREQW